MTVLPIEILLVEDNEGDVFLTTEAFKSAKVANHLSVARDGEEAMEFLNRTGRFPGAPRPDLVLLDLNLPRKDGRQVLAEMKADAGLRSIPTVVLTSSQAEQDVVKVYDLHASAYVVKPVDFPNLMEIVHAIEGFWFSVVKLPPNGNH
jgi:CheY-like chemotaxis protein